MTIVATAGGPNTDPGQMTATELAAFIEAKETKHRPEMKALRALLKVRQEGIK